MDFSEKEAIPWVAADPSSTKTGFFDFPCMMPEFPFPALSEVPPFFFMPEADFSMFPLKKEEDGDLPFSMFFFPPDANYAPAEPVHGDTDSSDDKPTPVAASKSHDLIRPRVPYPHAKKVGTISVEERRLKIEKYLEKRSRRTYGKKVSYACRKRVADTRIRVKGRFVAKKIAEALKGMENEKNNVSLHLLK